jgi:hypothetical protein
MINENCMFVKKLKDKAYQEGFVEGQLVQFERMLEQQPYTKTWIDLERKRLKELV